MNQQEKNELIYDNIFILVIFGLGIIGGSYIHKDFLPAFYLTSGIVLNFYTIWSIIK